MEGDKDTLTMQLKGDTFQSTPSVWRETEPNRTRSLFLCISIHSLRMEGDLRCVRSALDRSSFQSTPSVWRETSVCGRQDHRSHISIHSLRMEGDSVHTVGEPYVLLFQSTPSVWRETPSSLLRLGNLSFQSTPSVWRETTSIMMRVAYWTFQSTPSVWRETKARTSPEIASVISIHSLRMEGDHPLSRFFTFWLHFNPLPPYGGRHRPTFSYPPHSSFQSTPSVWRETIRLYGIFRAVGISIHSLRMEGDAVTVRCMGTSPISIHSLRMEGDIDLVDGDPAIIISIHSLRMEGDCAQPKTARAVQDFNPLPPYGGRLVGNQHSSDVTDYFNPLPPYGGRRSTYGKSTA